MPTLYHCTSSRGLRPLWTIEEMGIDCELVVMPYPPRTKAPEFLEINPLGTVPFLVDGDTRMSESAAIPTYLANIYGPTDLLVRPDEPDYGAFLDLVDYGEASLMGALAPACASSSPAPISASPRQAIIMASASPRD